ncbi:cation:proton antiporter domain-containing protein [Natrarchaeobaculum sulfurireducens]|uniref:TrkA, K+ transport system, NAD-binding component n=1 Tax=Natrarchaeobaculum sulfurireducens TaxID=2044521 RepID=A0A346PJP8_9EURY|nr:cation:proton antiporter [Natrarchaeobaculum sulfurireducens]AXR79743.1 TrkA, K+ transport system, NAD-binding component [Natrarchaeobaculum sulfurireducens]
MENVLPVVVGILALGVGAQVLAKRLRVPSVLFLIVIGVGVGPEGLGFVSIETFGDGLSTVVGLSVAIIIFDGAFHLRREKLREAPRAVFRMTTVGAALAFFGTTLAVRVFLGTGWDVAALIGALLIATGPTVITPLLEVVTVRDHVATTLEAEGIFNDVSAAVLAIVIFEAFVVGGAPAEIPVAFLQRLVAGIGVGIVVAIAVRYLLVDVGLPAGDATQVARLVTLTGALVSFGLAESIFPETGVAAAAAAGVVLGNLELPHREEILSFNRDLTLVVLSFVFISLAALIDFDALLGLGIGGVAVVVAVTLVVRPILVAISTTHWRFSRNEKYFLSLVGPRGIIPASVATLFAIELEAAGQFEAARTLAGTVFLVIFITVVLQAGLARQIAERLHVVPMKSIIVGGGRVGRALATRLEKRGENVHLIDRDPNTVTALREDGFSAHEGDGTAAETLRAAGIEDAKLVVATTADDDVNLLVSQLARTTFDVENVVARVNTPGNVSAFDAVGVQAIDVASATAWSIDNEIERPALAHWMNELGEGHDAQEIVVTAEELDGATIRELSAEIPDGCIVAVVAREGETYVPDAEMALEAGDRITFIGREEAVSSAVKRFHPHDA